MQDQRRQERFTFFKQKADKNKRKKTLERDQPWTWASEGGVLPFLGFEIWHLFCEILAKKGCFLVSGG